MLKSTPTKWLADAAGMPKSTDHSRIDLFAFPDTRGLQRNRTEKKVNLAVAGVGSIQIPPEPPVEKLR